MTKPKQNINYEQSFAELERLVNSLENTDLPLEQALDNFEQGIKLTNACQKALSQAEQKVHTLMKKNNNLEEPATEYLITE